MDEPSPGPGASDVEPVGVDEVVTALLRCADEVADRLADAVAAAVPEQWRDLVDSECRPLTHEMTPHALRHLLDGRGVPPALMAGVRVSGSRYPGYEIPLEVGLMAIRASLVEFYSIIRVEPGRPPLRARRRVVELALLTGRSAFLIIDVVGTFANGYAQAVARRGAPPQHPVVWQKATPLARDCLRLAARGLTNRQIAESLRCSPQTVNYHLRTFMSSLGAANRTALVAQAQRSGLLSLEG